MLHAAAAAGIAVPPRRTRVFDEVVDIVAADLVLVLDHFDLTEARTSPAARVVPERCRLDGLAVCTLRGSWRMQRDCVSWRVAGEEGCEGATAGGA